MKKTTIYVLLAGIIVMYAGCKKSSSNASGPALAPKTVAAQVALNVDQSLFGDLGFDLSQGLSAPTAFAVHTKGKVLQGLNNPDCGLVIDTTLSYSVSYNHESFSYAGSIKFAFQCVNDVISGFTTTDNLTISVSIPDTSVTYKVAENLTLASTQPGVDDANLSLTGSLSSSASYSTGSGSSKVTGTASYSYTLSSVIYSPVDGDVVSGSATFTTQGSGPKGSWNYQGTITFLGNHLAKVVINGSTYTVNLQTGVVV